MYNKMFDKFRGLLYKVNFLKYYLDKFLKFL